MLDRGSLQSRLPSKAAGLASPWLAAGFRLLLPFALVIGVLSCGTSTAGSGSDAMGCPARAPAAGPALAGGAAAGPLIHPGPIIALICQYAPGLPSSKRRVAPVPRIVLRKAAAADGLAALLDDARPLAASAPRCAALGFTQLIEFGYQDGAVARAAVTFCPAGADVTAGHRRARLGPPVSDGLLFYTSMHRHDHGPRTPDLIGLAPATAAAAAAKRHFRMYFAGARLDARARFGHVIFQSLPPGAISGPGNQVSVIVAVRNAPSCVRAQLALSYRGGGFGAGNDFGGIIISNTSARPCRLTGRARLTGLSSQGRPVTNTVAARIGLPGVLSPLAAPIPPHASPPPGELVYRWNLDAEYRDGPASIDRGYCQSLWVIPATWRLVLPGAASFTIGNTDPSNNNPLSPSGGLVTCQGKLGADKILSYLTP
jgi:hypothetical protein